MSSLHCLHCGRPVIRFAVSVPTKTGAIGWGPKCAARAGISTTAKPRREPRVRNTAPAVDPRQTALEFEVTAA